MGMGNKGGRTVIGMEKFIHGEEGGGMKKKQLLGK